MKAQARFLGFDDAPFSFRDARVPVVGVALRAPNYVEGVLVTDAAVDGTDATGRLREAVLESRYREGTNAILLDGAAVGGFNVVDIDALHEAVGVPVITVTREAPDLEAMEAVLRRKFPDWERRASILRRHALHTIPTEHKPVHATFVGAGLPDVKEMLRIATVRGAMPEPLRIAHLIAAALVKGESRGRA